MSQNHFFNSSGQACRIFSDIREKDISQQKADGSMKAKVSVIIPAYNESARIGFVLREVAPFAHEILVIDDGSQDNTGEIALTYGARVIRQENSGYIKSIKVGFKVSKGDIMVTLDADGENDPADIPRLIKPLLEDRADVVLGKRNHIPRPSERLLSWMTRTCSTSATRSCAITPTTCFGKNWSSWPG